MKQKPYTLVVTAKNRETGEIDKYENVHDIGHYYGTDENGFNSYLRLLTNETDSQCIRICIPLDKCDVEITKGNDGDDFVIVSKGLHSKDTVVPKLVKIDRNEYIMRCSGCNAIWLRSNKTICQGCGKNIDWTGGYISERKNEE